MEGEYSLIDLWKKRQEYWEAPNSQPIRLQIVIKTALAVVIFGIVVYKVGCRGNNSNVTNKNALISRDKASLKSEDSVPQEKNHPPEETSTDDHTIDAQVPKGTLPNEGYIIDDYIAILRKQSLAMSKVNV